MYNKWEHYKIAKLTTRVPKLIIFSVQEELRVGEGGRTMSTPEPEGDRPGLQPGRRDGHQEGLGGDH